MLITKTENLNNDHYVVASNRMYCIGNQDGTFSPLGYHVDGEMSGIFSQPLKVAKGFILSKNGNELHANHYAFDLGASIFTYENMQMTMNALDNQRALNIRIEKQDEEVITFAMNLNLQGCWTAEEIGFKKGKTEVIDKSKESVYVKHQFESYFVAVNVDNENEICLDETELKIDIKDSCNILIMVSSESCEALKAGVNEVVSKRSNLIKEQRTRRAELLNRTKIEMDETSFTQAFNALKLNYDMLVQKTDAVGESYTAGYPEFQWLFGCDTTYGIHGTLAVGQFEMTKQTLRLLKDISLKTNGIGRVVHEVSPFGYVYNEGNLQEAPHFIVAVAETYRWTGDKAFLEEMFDFCASGMKWAESMIEPGSLCPVGSGIIEVPGIHGRVIDIAILTIDAYKELEYMCVVLGKEDRISEYEQKRIALQEEVVDKFYSKESEFFGDVICTKKEILEGRDLLVNSIKNTKTLTKHMGEYFDELLKKDYAEDELIPVVLKNWVTIIPYVQDFVSDEIKEKGVKQMQKPEFYNHFGMKLACMVDDKHDEVDDVYTLNKSMSINTGYLVEVFAKNHHLDKAYDLLLELANAMKYEMPVALSEILPDDGCFMQFWSGYGIHHVFIRHILGIFPDAGNKQIFINPQLPTKLNYVKISNLRVGDCEFEIEMKRADGKILVDVNSSKKDYKVIIEEV